MAEDLVCGMQVDEKKAKHMYEYKGKKYYFCAPGCKLLFSKNPEKFLAGERMRMGEGGGCCARGH
jgi:YHS domain-containing protein